MTIFKRFLASTTMTTAVVAGATLSANASDLSGFSATYVLNADGKKGTATRTLIKNGDDYHYHVKASAVGVASMNQSASFSLLNGRYRCLASDAPIISSLIILPNQWSALTVVNPPR